MAICEQCGKEHDGTFGSGRFCNRSCSNKWVALHQSDEAKARKIEKSSKNLVPGWKGHNHSEETKKAISESVKKSLSNTGIRKKISDANKGKVRATETRKKISDSMHLAIEEGRHDGWANRRNSYPEKYWSEVLTSLGISYTREHPVSKSSLGSDSGGCYFLDFLLPGNVDLEIDGSQHEYAREYDECRDNLLRNAGYKVYRVRWHNPVYNKELVLSQIEEFKSWYNNVCPISSVVE